MHFENYFSNTTDKTVVFLNMSQKNFWNNLRMTYHCFNFKFRMNAPINKNKFCA